MTLTDLLIQLFYLIISFFLAHFVISRFVRFPLTQTEYLYLVLLALLIYWFLTQIHASMYLERFDIDPNIQTLNTQAYQFDNYQQSITPYSTPASSLDTPYNTLGSPLSPLTVPAQHYVTAPDGTKVPVTNPLYPVQHHHPHTHNVGLDALGNLTTSSAIPTSNSTYPLTFPSTPLTYPATPLTYPATPLTYPSKCLYPTHRHNRLYPIQPTCNLTPSDRLLQMNALSGSPSTSLYTYDSGLSTSMPLDSTTMDQLQSFIRDEVSKYYSSNGLIPGMTAPNLPTLRSMVAQKINERMPYINARIRQAILENLDKLIEAHLNELFNFQTTTAPSTVPSAISPVNAPLYPTIATPTKTQPLLTNALGQLYYQPTSYMETMSDLGANSDTSRTFFDIPRAAYRNLSDEPLAMSMNSTPWYTYKENLMNGEKMGTYQLYSPQNVAQDNSMSGKWLVRPWAF